MLTRKSSFDWAEEPDPSFHVIEIKPFPGRAAVGEMRDWLKADESLDGEYIILASMWSVSFHFSDLNTAFKFKLRWG